MVSCLDFRFGLVERHRGVSRIVSQTGSIRFEPRTPCRAGAPFRLSHRCDATVTLINSDLAERTILLSNVSQPAGLHPFRFESSIVTLQYPLSYLALAASCGGVLWITGHTRWWWVGAIASWVGVSFALLALIYFANWPALLGKTRRGTRWFWAWPLFWPYFLLCELSLLLARKSGQLVLCAEISPGVYLGRKLTPEEAEKAIQEFGIRGVVDLAAEFGEVPLFREAEYFSLPALDAMSPDVERLRQCVIWIDRVRKTGPVYLHCALGHGRAATAAAAYLVYAGLAKDANDAIRKVRAARPGVKLSEGQRAAVAAIRRAS